MNFNPRRAYISPHLAVKTSQPQRTSNKGRIQFCQSLKKTFFLIFAIRALLAIILQCNENHRHPSVFGPFVTKYFAGLLLAIGFQGKEIEKLEC